ncbi:MAG: translesion DNA synthesis-associated protein ImuA [Lysobacteraceae bacterium]
MGRTSLHLLRDTVGESALQSDERPGNASSSDEHQGDELHAALREGRVFRGTQSPARGQGSLPSGIDTLDAALPWGGFPRGALTELLVAADGLGEFSLLMPALAALARHERILLVAPPYVPYAPALLRHGLPLRQLHWIDSPAERALWTAEQALRAGCVGAVLAWTTSGDERALRRLQVAAEDGGSFGFVLRPAKQAVNPSPAALRLLIEARTDSGRDDVSHFSPRPYPSTSFTRMTAISPLPSRERGWGEGRFSANDGDTAEPAARTLRIRILKCRGAQPPVGLIPHARLH